MAKKVISYNTSASSGSRLPSDVKTEIQVYTQPLDSDLTAIAALSPADNDFIQRKSGAWTNRTVNQVKSDLGVSNTSFVKRTAPTPSGGSAGWRIPGYMMIQTSTVTIASATDVYHPFVVNNPDGIVVTAWGINVTTGPGSSANIRVGIYDAISGNQPHGSNAPKYDSGDVAVASGFTGAKGTSGLSVNLAQGVYLLAMNASTSMVVRSSQTVADCVPDDLSNAVARTYTVSRTYAAFPTPGTAWTATSSNSPGVFLKWTEN